MNVLFLMPKTVSALDEWYVFPTGIAYVSSALKQHKTCNVYTKNLNTVEDIKSVICNMIDQYNIDIIATGGLTIQYHSIRDIITIAKSHNPHIITMVGGGYITSAPLVAMTAIPLIDIGMIGEGEYTICDLIDTLQKGTSLSNVKGIIFRNENGIVIENERRKPIEDLDKLPYPDYDGFDFESTLKYSPVNYGIYNKRSAVLITSRGCPYNCTFCFHPQGDKYRTRSLDSVFAELEWLIDKYQIESVLILDELFGGNQKRLIDFCNRIKKYHLKWWVETRVQYATIENLKLMKESGCAQALFGIENVNDSILKSMNKHVTFAEVEMALKNAYEIGLSAPGVLIFGDPAETKETAENTITWWMSHPEYNIVLTTVQIYPGSIIWNHAVKIGKLRSLESQVEYIKAGCPKLNISGLNDDAFSDLCKRIGSLNQKRIVHIVSPSVSNERWRRGKLYADVIGKCARCNAENFWPSVNLLAEGGGAENFICSECGQAHTNSMYDKYFKNAVKNLLDINNTNLKVALWGQGRRLAMLYESYNDLKDTNFFYVDNSPLKWGKNFFHLQIHNPDLLTDYQPDIIIVAVGDANLDVVLDKIDVLSKMCRVNLNERVVLLGELFNSAYDFNWRE